MKRTSHVQCITSIRSEALSVIKGNWLCVTVFQDETKQNGSERKTPTRCATRETKESIDCV